MAQSIWDKFYRSSNGENLKDGIVCQDKELPVSSSVPQRAGTRPTMVTETTGQILLEINLSDPVEPFTRLGFVKSSNYERVYWFDGEPDAVFAMCETLRDMGVPFSTHRHMGADYQIEICRERGLVAGKFMRINFFGRDRQEDAPYRLEEF